MPAQELILLGNHFLLFKFVFLILTSMTQLKSDHCPLLQHEHNMSLNTAVIANSCILGDKFFVLL